MLRFAANLTLLFPEAPPLERFALAARAGFRYVEMLFPYQLDLDDVERTLRAQRLELVLFNVDPGDFAAGERGYLCDPARTERFREKAREAIELAQRLGTRRLNALAGLVPPGVDRATAVRTAVENLRAVAPLAERAGVTLHTEALNTVETPGYLIDRSALGLEIVRAAGSPAVRFQYDAYHMQIMEGDLISTIRANVRDIGHVQIADVPGRHEPGSGEIAYGNVLRALDEAGYDGFVGLEYKPTAGTAEGLAWMERLDLPAWER